MGNIMTVSTGLIAARWSAAFFAAILIASPTAALAAEPAYVVGADAGANPYVISNPDGTITGFNVDIANEVSRRLGRPKVKVIDQQFSALFAGLNAKRYEFIIAPVTITKERADNLLLSESIVSSSYQFIAKKGGKQVKSLDDLKNLRVAVNTGSAYDSWANDNKDKYNLTISRYGKTADAFQAVLTGRADVAMSGDGNVMYAAAQNKMLVPSYKIPTGAAFAWAFRRDDTALRATIENTIKCMKQDGTMAKIYRTWFGSNPPANDPVVTVTPGLGIPNMNGYDPSAAAPNCKR